MGRDHVDGGGRGRGGRGDGNQSERRKQKNRQRRGNRSGMETDMNMTIYTLSSAYQSPIHYNFLASLLLPLLLLLIVIFDGVGTYEEIIIMDWGLVC